MTTEQQHTTTQNVANVNALLGGANSTTTGFFDNVVDKKPEDKKEEKSAEIVQTKPEVTEQKVQEEKKITEEEYNSVKSRFEENQKYARKINKKVKGALEHTQKLMDDNAIPAEAAQAIMAYLSGDGVEDIEEKRPATLWDQMIADAGEEFKVYLKYADDALAQDYADSFDYAVSMMTAEEKEELQDELEDVKDDRVKLLKKMLAVGKEYYEKTYKHIKTAGSMKKFIESKDVMIEKLQRDIDKMKKKLSQYEDYDKPNYRISDESPNDGKSQKAPLSGVDKILGHSTVKRSFFD